MYLICGVGVGLAVVGLGVGWGRWWLVALAVLLVVVGVVAARLTVTVDELAVIASFGWGWPRRRIELNTIEAAAGVDNSWWHGWGIRKVRGGWMYNNAGRESVELTMRSGKVFRIGTDEPAALLAAVDQARRTA